jgi:hypothetical protein
MEIDTKISPLAFSFVGNRLNSRGMEGHKHAGVVIRNKDSVVSFVNK